MDHVEAVIQVFAETAFFHEGKQIDVRGRDDAHIDFNLFGAAQAHEFAFLNDAQQLRLRFRTDGGNFVEEDGALIGDFKKSLFRGNRAGEGAADVPEQLRFEQIDGNGAGVHRDKCFIDPWRCGMNGLGDQLFTGAAFSAD